MSLTKDIHQQFCNHGWTWSIKGQGRVIPTENDIKVALDLAAEKLYTEFVGAILEVGRLVIIKQATGLDVYVLAGTIDAKSASETQGEK